MSYVSTITLLIGDYEKKDLAVEKLNEYFTKEEKLGVDFIYIDGCWAAGTKYPERKLLWAAINYLNTEEFIEFVKSLELEDSILTIASPDHNKYIVVPLVDTELESL